MAALLKNQRFNGMEAYIDICRNEPLSGAFICVFSRKVLIVKVVYRWMNLFKPVMHSFCWTTAILKLFQKHNGPSRSLKHGVWKFLHLQSIQDERKKNEKLVKANWVFLQLKLSSQVDKFLFRLQQVSCKHCLKSQSEYPLAFPKSWGEHWKDCLLKGCLQ